MTKGELDAAVTGSDEDKEAGEARDHDELLKAFEEALGERVATVAGNRLASVEGARGGEEGDEESEKQEATARHGDPRV